MENKGKYIGTFRCLKKLGNGACGVVYLARLRQSYNEADLPSPVSKLTKIEKQLSVLGAQSQQESEESKRSIQFSMAPGQLVAIKVMNNNVKNLFKAEIVAYRLLKSRNILRCFGYYEDLEFIDISGKSTQIDCLVLEYAQKGELFQFLEKQALSEGVARYYFRTLLRGIIDMNKAGLAHYDLKLENIFVDGHFQLKIGDFGASCMLNVIPRKKSGTKSYRAPEYLQNKHLSGIMADMFSLGVILFIFVTGKMPFLDPVNTDHFYKHIINQRPDLFWDMHEQLLTKHLKDEQSAQLKNIPKEYSKDFKDLITNMIQSNPAARISLADVALHPWTQGNMSTYKEAMDEFQKIESSLIATIQEKQQDSKTQSNQQSF